MSSNTESSLKKIGVILAVILNLLTFIEKVTSFSIPFVDFRYVTYPLALISLIILVITLIKWRYERESNFLFLKRGYFIGLVIFVISLVFIIGLQIKSNRVLIEPRERIVVLLPLDKDRDEEPAFQDGKRQAYGFIDLLEKKNEINNKYDIVFVDHQMNTQVAIETVQRELKNGTNYFISTMSHISERLSVDFNNLVDIYKKGDKEKPKLIVTVSSSNNIKVCENRIYRYYIRSNEESKLLADYYSKLNVDNRLIAIYGTDNYGSRAREIFNDIYERPFDVNIPLKISWGEDRIKEEIKKKITNSNDDKNTFFIVHYGSGLDAIITCLYDLGHRGQLLISHPITVEEWQAPIRKKLTSYEWITCCPESPDGAIYPSNDIIRDFVYFTLHRLIETIESAKINECDFDLAWKQAIEPSRISYRINDDGDSEIQLRINHNNRNEATTNN